MLRPTSKCDDVQPLAAPTFIWATDCCGWERREPGQAATQSITHPRHERLVSLVYGVSQHGRHYSLDHFHWCRDSQAVYLDLPAPAASRPARTISSICTQSSLTIEDKPGPAPWSGWFSKFSKKFRAILSRLWLDSGQWTHLQTWLPDLTVCSRL